MRARSFLPLVLALLGLGCSAKRDRPDTIAQDCDGGSCIKPGNGGGGGGTSGDGGLDAASDAPGDAPAGVTVTGTVVELTGDDFFNAVPYSASATIEIDGATGIPVAGTYNGSTFKLDGVKDGPGVWATVTPSKVGAILPTLQPVDTSASPVELALVPAATLDTIYAFLSIPVQREVGAAHVVVRFLDAKTGVPVTGVTVTHGTDVVAYDTGGSWSDTAPGTGVAGYAVVVNVSTGKTPNQQSFKFKAATASAAVSLWVQPDSVTLADVLVN